MSETEIGYVPEESNLPPMEMSDGMIKALGGEPKANSTEEQFKKQQELERELAEERRRSQLSNRRFN